MGPEEHAAALAPRSGDEATFEVVDHAVATLGLLRGLWMGDDRVMLHLVASVIEQAERLLPFLVAEALESGSDWVEVATLLGITVEAARARFDPESPMRDGRGMWDGHDVLASAASDGAW
jgi:hypothetical protein